MDCGHRPLSRCQRHSTAGTVKSDAVPIVPDVEDVFEDHHKGNLRAPPPMPTPRRNKALLRGY